MNKTEKINKEKSKISQVYLDIRSSKENKLSVIDLGTGSGKTYAIFDSLRKFTKNKQDDFKCIDLFIAPLKSQLKDPIDNETMNIDDNIYSFRIAANSDYIYYTSNIFKFLEKNFKNIDTLYEVTNLNYKKYPKSNIEWKIENLKNKIKDIRYNLKEDKLLINEIVYIKDISFEDKDLLEEKYLRLVKGYQQFLINLVGEILDQDLLRDCDMNLDVNKMYVKIVETISPISLIDYFDNIIFKLTADKSITTQYQVYKTKTGKYQIKPIGTLFAMLSNIKNNSIFTQYRCKINLFLDEADQVYKKYHDKLFSDNSIKVIVSDLMAVYFQLLGDYSKDDSKEIYKFILNISKSRKKLDIQIKNYLIQNLQSRVNSTKDTKKVDMDVIRDADQETKKIVKKIINNYGAQSYSSLKTAAEVYQLTIDKVKYFSLTKEKLSLLCNTVLSNTKSIIIKKEIFDKYRDVIDTIFFKQEQSVYLSNKEELTKLKVVVKESSINHIEIVEAKDIKNSVSLYEFLMMLIFILNIVKQNKLQDIIKDIKENDDESNKTILLDIKKKLNSFQFTNMDVENISKIIEENQDLQEITDRYVYEQDKFLFRINPSRNYNATNSDSYVDLSISFEKQESSPEKMILDMISPSVEYNFDHQNRYIPSCNIYLISATTGWESDYIFQWDFQYIKRYYRSILNKEFSIQNQAIEDIKISLAKIREKESINVEQFSHTELITNHIDIFLEHNSKLRDIEKMYLNRWKKIELQNLFDTIEKLYLTKKYNASLVFTQTTQKLKIFFDSLANQNNFLAKDGIKVDYYEPKFKERIYKMILNEKSNKMVIKIILYKSTLDTRYDDTLGYGEFDKILQTGENEKVIVISDYHNGSTGLNFIQKYNKTIDKDFDTLTYAMDRYYKAFSDISKDTKLPILLIKMKFILNNQLTPFYNMSNVDAIDKNGSKHFNEFFDFKNYLDDISFIKDFQQANGRSERKDNNSFIDIFINEDTYKRFIFSIKNIEKSGKDINKLMFSSPINSYLYNQVDKYTKSLSIDTNKKQLLLDLQDDQIDICNNFIDDILNKLEAYKNGIVDDFSIVETYNKIRSKECIYNPKKYIRDLKEYFKDDPEGLLFANSVYLINHYYTDNEQFKEDIKKLQYYKNENGKTYISDISDTTSRTSIKEDIKNRISFLIQNDLKDDLQDIFKRKLSTFYNLAEELPMFDFYQRIILGVMLEDFFEEYLKYIQDRSINNNFKIYGIDDYKENYFLVERFDFYIMNYSQDILYAIDTKNWTRYSDKKYSEQTIKNSLKKKEFLESKLNKKVEIIFVNMLEGDNMNIDDDRFTVCSLFYKYEQFNIYNNKQTTISFSSKIEELTTGE